MNSPAPVPAATEDKTVAVVAYLTLVGFIAAIIIHNGKKTALGAYHLRQAMGIVLSYVALGVLYFVSMAIAAILVFVPILAVIVGGAMYTVCGLVGLFITVLWVVGLIYAINGQEKPVPVLGALFQKWFKTAFV